MKVLVACEFSGRVRDAFTAKGHNAWSCDLLASETPGQHYKGDVRKILDKGWDLMIAHPPCTFLCSSGLHWNDRIPERQARTNLAVEFFLRLWDADIPRIAVENPVGCMSSILRKPDQYIQPWEYGEPETKLTCLWLKNLPLLKPTNIMPLDNRRTNMNSKGQNKIGDQKDRERTRSLTYNGWAEAFADQWGTEGEQDGIS